MTWADAFGLASIMAAFVAIAYLGVKASDTHRRNDDD